MGFVKDAIGGVVGGVGDVLGSTVGKIPGIGDVVQAGLPIAGSIFGGPLGGALGGAVAGGMQEGGPTGEGILRGAGQGLSTQQMLEAFRQQQADAERARELVNQGVGFSGQSADIAMNQFQQDQPLRQAFRQGALGFSDPTNPFAQSAGAGMMMPQPQPQIDPRIAQGGGQPAEPQGPPPGSLSSRVQGMLEGGGDVFRADSRPGGGGGRRTAQSARGGRRSFGGMPTGDALRESVLSDVRSRIANLDIDPSQLPESLRA